MKNHTVSLALVLLSTTLVACEPESMSGTSAADRFQGVTPGHSIGGGALVGTWGLPGKSGGFGLIFGEDGQVTSIDYTPLASSVGVEMNTGSYKASLGQIEFAWSKSTCRTPHGLPAKLPYKVDGDILTIYLTDVIHADLARDGLPDLGKPQAGCIDERGYHL